MGGILALSRAFGDAYMKVGNAQHLFHLDNTCRHGQAIAIPCRAPFNLKGPTQPAQRVTRLDSE